MSFIYNAISSFLTSLLQSLGLSNKKGNLLLLGLDNAGKTTLLHKLSTGDLRPFPPTDRPRQDSFVTNTGLSFVAWDVGGHEAVRHMWEDFIGNEVNAVLFLIDASDHDRLEEAAYELDALINEQVLENIPIALMFNKCDLETALSNEEICKVIDYENLEKTQGQHKIRIFRISVLKGEGYQDAFRWIGGNFL